MERHPIVHRDEYTVKQTDTFMTPIKRDNDVTLKAFKYSYNHTDKERVEVSFLRSL
jgi:hypothetical protein